MKQFLARVGLKLLLVAAIAFGSPMSAIAAPNQPVPPPPSDLAKAITRAQAVRELAMVHYDAEEWESAIPLFERAIGILTRVNATGSDTATLQGTLGDLYTKLAIH
jgi:hypothetical protein